MPDESNPRTDPNRPMTYQIRIKGHLDRKWVDWFGEVTIALEEDDITLLTCSLVDQAALYGLLKRIRDLGMPLLSVQLKERKE